MTPDGTGQPFMGNESSLPPSDVLGSASARRDPARSLEGCKRVLVLGRTGSGKTTLAGQLAASLGVPHIELDSLYFGRNFSTVPVPVLRERTSAALAAERWVTDGNKSAVRDIVWPLADTVVWLDYPLVVSLWRLGGRAIRRTAVIKQQTAESHDSPSLRAQMYAAARGVLKALRSHRGQRSAYPKMFAEPHNQHLSVLRLRTPRATRLWLTRVVGSPTADM